MTISVAVADDQALVRVGFCGIIAATPGFSVVGEAANGEEAVAVARSAKPDVVLMDVRMPVLDGIEATHRITASPEAADVRVIILTTFDLDEYVFGALRAGASGFLLKDTLPADLLTAIRVVAAGEALLAPSVTRRLISEFAKTATPARARRRQRWRRRRAPVRPPAACAPATSRSCSPSASARCCVSSLPACRTRRSPGRLCISPATAKTHVAHLLTKLDSRDRVQLVIIAYQAWPHRRRW